MSTDAELALRIVTVKALTDYLKGVDREARAELEVRLQVTERKAAVLPNGEMVGAVTKAKGRAGVARVDDVEAFTAWVKETAPTEVITVPEVVVPAHDEVRPSWQAEVLKRAGETARTTGEIPPGVSLGADGAPTLTVPKLPAGAAELIAEAFRTGALAATFAIEAPR